MKIPAPLIWIIAFLLTVATAVYQRMTGPTYPVRGSITLADHDIRFRLPRAHGDPTDARIAVEVPSPEVTGYYEYRRFRSHDDWTRRSLQRTADKLVATLPLQPAAGKVMYQIVLQTPAGDLQPLTDEPVIIRFRGSVPAPILIAHIITIFAGMLVSTATGLYALRRGARPIRLAIITIIGLTLGGLILGPIVQKYAFDAFWTGWPFGHDLTDNKTAAAVMAWLIALWRLKAAPKSGRWWAVGAAVITMIIWLIPHSVLGSELDYTQLENAA